MASTNHTPNYELSQFLPKDLPTWLGDYNGDMDKIDTAMATNRSSAESALVTANAADSTATASAAKVNQLEKEVDALKAIIAEGNEVLSVHRVALANKVSTIPTLNLYCNNAGNIINISLRGSWDSVENAWNTQTGAFIADIVNPSEISGLAKNTSFLFFQGHKNTIDPSQQTQGLFGIGPRIRTDGTIGLFIQTYAASELTARYVGAVSSAIYGPTNVFPNVSTPTVVNFNEPIDTINVDRTTTLNVGEVSDNV